MNMVRLRIFLLLWIPVLNLAGQSSETKENLKEHVYFLASDSLLGRGFGTPQGLQAAHYIAGQFEQSGVEPVGGSYFHPFTYRRGILNIAGNNVAGIIRGSDPDLRDEYILLGAHYDHLGWELVDGDTVVFNGADDNASGTAALIEIGRMLAADPASLGRSVILVAFDGEESGLVGAEFFLEDRVVPPHLIKAMFSIDMVGMVAVNGGLDLVGVKMLNDSEYLVNPLAAEHDLVIAKSNRRSEGRTDTAPFGKQEIPNVHAFTGLKSPYHKPGDEAHLLDFEGMAKVTRYLSAATRYLSSRDRLSEMEGPPELPGEPPRPRILQAGGVLALGSGEHNYRGDFFRGKSIFSAGAGLALNIRLTGFLDLQPEVLYRTSGSEHPDGIFRTHSASAPVSLRLLTPEGGFMRSYIEAGGFYSYHFAGTVGGDPIDFSNEFEPSGFGYTFGAGVEAGQIQWGITFQRGLTDIDRSDGTDIREESFQFRLRYLF